ncbi:hypothetical protein GCM10010345_69430 [Streptomyces canarius]|uniref:Transposase IS701-like DDE domain-containing protein n=1 Tax=Streptomyces canarius TaxID=285453 RepID=A0ABQ3D319_9ACTN|nr:hypothetical protein GCM10010345_69430 [Streptomyces canarius]
MAQPDAGGGDRADHGLDSAGGRPAVLLRAGDGQAPAQPDRVADVVEHRMRVGPVGDQCLCRQFARLPKGYRSMEFVDAVLPWTADGDTFRLPATPIQPHCAPDR